MIAAAVVGVLTALAVRSPAPRFPPWLVGGVGALLAALLGYAEHWAGLP